MFKGDRAQSERLNNPRFVLQFHSTGRASREKVKKWTAYPCGLLTKTELRYDDKKRMRNVTKRIPFTGTQQIHKPRTMPKMTASSQVSEWSRSTKSAPSVKSVSLSLPVPGVIGRI